MKKIIFLSLLLTMILLLINCGTVGGGGGFDDDSSDAFIEDYCETPTLLSSTSGNFATAGYLWAELSQKGISTQIGSGLAIDGGSINSVYLTIPLAGLNLNEHQYSINYYYCVNPLCQYK